MQRARSGRGAVWGGRKAGGTDPRGRRRPAQSSLPLRSAFSFEQKLSRGNAYLFLCETIW